MTLKTSYSGNMQHLHHRLCLHWKEANGVLGFPCPRNLLISCPLGFLIKFQELGLLSLYAMLLTPRIVSKVSSVKALERY